MTDTSPRCPLIHIQEMELADWYGIGWHYCGQSEKPGYVIIEWKLSRPPVMPFNLVSHRVHEASSERENA